MVHLQAQTSKGESVLKYATLMLIILNEVCRSDIKEVHGNLSNTFFVKKVGGQKDPGEVDKCSNKMPDIDDSY